MIIQRVDDSDRPLGTLRRGDALSTGANFRVVHVLVLSHSGDLLLQRIAVDHDRHPLWWGSSVAGYVAINETYSAAALRKLRDELGIKKRPTLICKTEMLDGRSRKFIAVFAVKWSGPIAPNPEDFAALQFVPFAQVLKQPEALRLKLTPTFKHILRSAHGPLKRMFLS